MRFRDRADAGRRLARLLEPYRDRAPVVLALPRGGVPVAAEVAAALDAPLDVILVRKLGAPGQPELAIGAIGEGGVRVLNDRVLQALGVSASYLSEVEALESAELSRRSEKYRGEKQAVSVASRTAIVVDDGLATGATAKAAVEVARALGATRVVLAVPVAPPEAARDLLTVADDVVVVESPRAMSAIGEWYEDFTQTSDAEVMRLLSRSRD